MVCVMECKVLRIEVYGCKDLQWWYEVSYLARVKKFFLTPM